MARSATDTRSETSRPAPGDQAEQQLDDALERLAAFAPEYGVGLANHGPMAVGALCRLGRAKAIAEWTRRYCARLDPAPPASAAPGPPVLGELDRYPVWLALFESQLVQGEAWRPTLERWAAQLAPGLFGAAGHGLLRTAYAARALARRDTQVRRRELARGLAYWAARYRPLAGHARPSGSRSLRAVLADLPSTPLDAGPLIVDLVRSIDREPRVAQLLSQVERSELAVANLLAAFAPWAEQGAGTDAIAHVHVLTIPVAVMELLPLLPAGLRGAMLEYALHASSTLLVGWHPPAPIERGDLTDVPESSDIEALIDRAVQSGDEHAIKVVDACLLGFEQCADASLIRAARALCGRIAERTRAADDRDGRAPD